MVICIFGESCTGKSTLAQQLVDRFGGTIYTGKDYLRLAKNEAEARKAFRQLLESAAADRNALTVFVTTEPELLSLLPDICTRVLITAPLDAIKERFARRTGGTLPAGVAAMLERKHGCFDQLPHDFHISSETADLDAILAFAKR